MDGFSAHADKTQMLNWLSNFKKKPQKVFVVHGEHDMQMPFSQALEEKLGFSGNIPRYGDIAVIEADACHIEQADIEKVIPGSAQLQDAISSFKREYMEYRKQLEQLLAKNPDKLPELLKTVSKLKTFVKKNSANL